MKPIKTLKVSISGIRGVVGDTLKPALVARFSQSFAAYLGGGPIVVGRDTRTSGEMVKNATFAGLLSTGAGVIDVDICPVPTIQLAVRTLNARGGIAVTASHNPAEWNALKFIQSSGCFLNPYQAEELLNLYHQQDLPHASSSQIDSLSTYEGAIRDHVDLILNEISPALTPKLRVAVDCCNGAGSLMTPGLLRALGCEVIELNTTPDGRFPRPPEPVPANFTELSRLVRSEKVDVGFAQDADADRLAIVSEKGEAIGEEYTLALAVKAVLEQEKGPVVCNLSTSRMAEDIASAFGCPCYRSKIGEVNVTDLMREVGATIGGEGNGGVIYPRINMARDSFVAMALILELMRSSRKSISDLIGVIPGYEMSKSTYEVHPHRIANLLDEISEIYRDQELNTLDGVKIEREEGWIHIRPSNTEPILRLVIEARTGETLRKFHREFDELIRRS